MAVSQFLLILLLVIPCCSGGLVLYVRSNSNENDCPPGTDPTANCTLLSEYATDPYLLLDFNTTFVFLPGEHVLYTPLFIGNMSNVSDLTMKAQESEQSTSITCNQHGNITLLGLRNVDLLSLEFSSCNVSMTFIENTTIRHCRVTNVVTGPALVAMSNEIIYIENCTFTANADWVLTIVDSTLIFKGNEITDNSGPWIMSFASVTGDFANCSVTNNTAQMAAVWNVRFSNLTFSETNIFTANNGIFGVIGSTNSTLAFDGSTNFTDNRGHVGGVIVGFLLNVSFAGHTHFKNNVGETGAAVCVLSSQCVITGEHVTFVNNRGIFGGAFCIFDSTLTFMNTNNNVTFTENTALIGGSLFLSGVSRLNFLANEPGSVSFERNYASTRGGAIFIQDTDGNTYCTSAVTEHNLATQECSFQVVDYDQSITYQKRMFFIDNHAAEAGSAIFGGAIDNCILENSDDAERNDGQILFDKIVAIANSSDTTNSSVISSEPYILCACDGGEHNCAIKSITETVHPGGSVRIEVIAFGQRNGTVPAIIVATVDSPGIIGQLETNQRIPGKCSPVSYTVSTQPGNVSMELFTVGPCLITGMGLMVNLEVIECPPGFVLATIGTEMVCTCDPRLLEYTDYCNSSDGTILRNGKFWVGYDQELEGLIICSTCPFDYCTTDEISFKAEDSDAQCNYNREGILCGQCSDGLSIVLGSSRCKRCSDSYLAVLLFFAAAGVILVAFLLLLNLTVAVGTINGLIFYANIVATNESFIFPSNSNTYLDILRVFIAWINLDFGIESCFYDGMDTYALKWLQYAFPLYVWFLIGLVFVVSHYSTKASRILGSNPVAVLATLFMLSYTTIMRTIIQTFSYASIETAQNETKLVWMYDGNIPFLDIDDGRHLWLFVASLLILVFLLIPYTLLLLTSQWLQIKSHWKILSWLNKPQLRAFLDAYHAPYKPQHRYWTGLLLIIRFPVQLTAAVSGQGDPIVNFLVIQIFILLLQLQAWFSNSGGVYTDWYLNALEAFFLVNLGLLAASTHHINSDTASGLVSSQNESSQAAATSTLVTATLVATIGIVIFHAYRCLNIKCTKPVDEPSYQEDNHLEVATPTQSYVDIHTRARRRETAESFGLRESLLEDISR